MAITLCCVSNCVNMSKNAFEASASRQRRLYKNNV